MGVLLFLKCKRLCQGRPRRSLLSGMLIAKGLDCLPHQRFGPRSVTEHRGKLRLVGPQIRQIEPLGARPEEALRRIELRSRRLPIALGHHDRPGEEVRPRKVERVLGYLEQRNRAAHVIQRRGRLFLERAEPSQRPVEAHTCIRIDHLVRVSEGLVEHRTRFAELADIGQRIAEVGPETDVGCGVVRCLPLHGLETGCKEVDGSTRIAQCGITTAERFVDVRPLRRREQFLRRFQSVDRLGAPAAGRRSKAERDPRSQGAFRVAGSDRLVEDRGKHALCFVCGLAETELELRVGESELTVVDVSQIGPCLEILDRNSELSRQLAKRLDRWSACVGFDSRDVRI